MKKRHLKTIIAEFIDDQNNIIGYNTEPNSGADLDIKSDNKTTDQVVSNAHQNLGSDFLNRFGWWIGEDDDKNNPLKKEIALAIYSFTKNKIPFEQAGEEITKKFTVFADHILSICRKHMEETVTDKSSSQEKTLSESELKKIIEDVLTNKKDTSLGKKIDKDLLPKNLKNIGDDIDGLSKDDKDIIFNYIKERR